MFLLILESLGSTELFFILLMALVFFGPRKLPQLSRTMGKHLAEFRKASEDFKRTWEREVALEDIQPPNRTTPTEEKSILNPLLAAAPANEIVARNGVANSSLPQPIELPTQTNTSSDQTVAESPRKQDWL